VNADWVVRDDINLDEVLRIKDRNVLDSAALDQLRHSME
jgi:hypothetical protein